MGGHGVVSQQLINIERREYKYLIEPALVSRIRAAIRPFCSPDPYAVRSALGRYTIESLYFDTDDFRLFEANEHEQVDRFKARIRTYPETPGAPVFFEVKRRVNDVIAKSRGRVTGDWARLFRDPTAVPAKGGAGSEDAARERFLALAHTYHLHPVLLVRYEREPWASDIDTYARVTFDHAIRCQIQEDYSFDSNPRGWRLVDDGTTMRGDDSMVVLELKFTTQVPIWMIRVVKQFELYRRAYSKYGSSVRAWYAPSMPRRPRRLWM